MIECRQNVLYKKKHSSNNFLTSECITDITLFKWRQDTTKDKIVKRNKKKMLFFLPSSLERSFLHWPKRINMETFVLRHEWKNFFFRVVGFGTGASDMLWSYAIISIVFEVIRIFKSNHNKVNKKNRSSKKTYYRNL